MCSYFVIVSNRHGGLFVKSRVVVHTFSFFSKNTFVKEALLVSIFTNVDILIRPADVQITTYNA